MNTSTDPEIAAALPFLLSVDSPTVANAIERLGIRDRTDGYIGGSVRCQFPRLEPMVGTALTVTMTSKPGPPADKNGYWEMWHTLERLENPSVLVIADASGTPTRAAYAGEIMATLARKLGAVGMVTDGAFRDLKEVRQLGLHYFMSYPVVSHGNFQIETVGQPVVLDGQEVRTGDLLHGDENGIVIIPRMHLQRLPAAVMSVRESERVDLERIAADNFSLEEYESSHTYGS